MADSSNWSTSPSSAPASSGLSAAYELQKRNRSVAGSRTRYAGPGGIVWTERIGDFTIDAGPDALLIQKPAAVALCNELGIVYWLFPTKVPRTAFACVTAGSSVARRADSRLPDVPRAALQ